MLYSDSYSHSCWVCYIFLHYPAPYSLATGNAAWRNSGCLGLGYHAASNRIPDISSCNRLILIYLKSDLMTIEVITLTIALIPLCLVVVVVIIDITKDKV